MTYAPPSHHSQREVPFRSSMTSKVKGSTLARSVLDFEVSGEAVVLYSFKARTVLDTVSKRESSYASMCPMRWLDKKWVAYSAPPRTVNGAADYWVIGKRRGVVEATTSLDAISFQKNCHASLNFEIGGCLILARLIANQGRRILPSAPECHVLSFTSRI